jgi:hypothetical protein
MAWLAASMKPSLSCLILGHIRPGVSVMLMVGPRSMHICDLVTAGSSPTAATRRLSSAFISVDLPTLGMPMISMRSGLMPSLRCGASALHRLGTRAASPGFLLEIATALTPGWLL